MDTKISATIRPDQFAWIKRVKAETGATITHIVRTAIDAIKPAEQRKKTVTRKGGHAMIRCIACSLAINLFLASFILYLANMTPCIYTVIERCWR